MDPTLLAAIAELLGREVSEMETMSLEEISEALNERFNTAAADDATTIEALEAITVAAEGVRTAIAEADAAEAERADRIAALRERVAVPVAETEPPAEADDAEGEPEAPAEAAPEAAPEVVAEVPAPVADTEPAPAAADAPVAVPVAADAAPPAPRVHLPRRRPETHRPVETADEGALMTITAAADVPGYTAGTRIGGMPDLGQAFADRVHSLKAASGLAGKVRVATMAVEYPEDRVLAKDDTTGNTQRIERLTRYVQSPEVNNPQAIMAAGGLCAPVAVRYDLDNVSVDDRPVRNSLLRFNADRGGINFITPPKLSGITSGVGVVTEAQDTSGTTKSCMAITCGTAVEVDVSAVYQCLEVGNFNRRFFPEQFATWWALAGAAHARAAEGALLDGIAAAATNTTDGQNLGAARDILEAGVRARAQLISRHRMDKNTLVRWLVPEWVQSMIRADLIREHAGSPVDIVRTDAQIEAYFAASHIAVTWYKDTATGEGQVYAAQGVQALLGWKLTPVTYMFPEGSFLFLDGGTLDLGIEIRDTTMNTANNVRAFTESFENVAFVGVEAIEISHSLCLSGSGSLDIAVTCPENS